MNHRVDGVPLLVRNGVPGSDDCGVGRIRSTEIVRGGSKGRGRNGRRIILVSGHGIDVQTVKWEILRVILEHECLIEGLGLIVFPRKHGLVLFLVVGFHMSFHFVSVVGQELGGWTLGED